MRNIRALTGIPVLTSGRQIGRVSDAVLNDALTEMTGLRINCGLRGARYIPREQVLLLGGVAVFIKGEGLRAVDARGNFPRRALSSDGKHLGAIVGAMLDTEAFAVCALELSSGAVDDLISGRKWICQYSVNRSSGDVIVDPGLEKGGKES